MVVAYLHDTLEDTDETFDDLKSEFGLATAETVAVLTDEPGVNRKARKLKTNKKLAETKNTLALIVKAADRLANLNESVLDVANGKLEMYRKEHAAFREAAYRCGLCDVLWCKIESIISPTADSPSASIENSGETQ